MITKPQTIIETLALLAVMAIAAVCYLPSFSADWNFDDFQHIVNNEAIHATDLSIASLSRAVTESYLKNRPLSYLSFALDYRIAGLDLWQFHLTNLIIHLACTLLVWALLRALFMAPPFAANVTRPRSAALIAALAFAIHPLQTESVTYVVQRMNLLAALFTLAALYGWLRIKTTENPTRRAYGTWTAAAVVLAGAGLAAKENALAIVLFILALDRGFTPTTFSTWVKARWRHLLALLAVSVIVTALFAYGAQGLFSGYARRDFTMAQRLLTQPRVILMYIQLALWPAHNLLNINHNVITSTSLFHPLTTIPAIAIIVGLTMAALWRAEKAPLLAAGWLWFMAGLVIESSFIPLEMAFEHRMYLPLVGLIMIAADLAGRLRQGRKALAPLGLVLVCLAGSTYCRNRVWDSFPGLWRDAARKAPLASRPWHNLCAGALGMPESNYGIFWCRRSVALGPESGADWYNLGVELMRRERWREAEEAIVKSIKYDPDWADAYFQLGRLLARRGDIEDALANFKQAAEREPQDPVYWFQLGAIELDTGDRAAGCDSLRQALLRSHAGPPDLKTKLENAIRDHCGP